jgi:hypothetical protein
MYEVKIRYNTNAVNSDDLHWRVIVDGKEFLARNVEINIPTYTTKDFIKGVGEKWHITTKANSITWKGENCVIN